MDKGRSNTGMGTGLGTGTGSGKGIHGSLRGPVHGSFPGVKASALDTDLLSALDRREIEVLFQPQFSCSTGAVVGAEAVDVVADANPPVALNINVASTTPSSTPPTLVPLGARGLWYLDIERGHDGVRLLPGWHTTAQEGTDAGVVVDGGIAVTVLSGCFATVHEGAAAAVTGRLTARLRGIP